MNLRLDWCSYEAAKYAVTHWHYSRRMPAGKLVRIGVWEDGRFVGVVLFGWGASPPMFKRFKNWLGVQKNEACELVRIALSEHSAPVSRIVAIAIRMLRKHCPGLRLIVSFADADQNHHGGIYQAGNWIYAGLRAAGESGYLINGRKVHPRSMPVVAGRNTLEAARRIDPRATRLPNTGKHQYFYVLDAGLRDAIMQQSQPYPKRAGSVDSDAVADQATEGGANPTPAL